MSKKKIILFGSFARGDYRENNDTDLIIIGDFSRRFFDRIGILVDLVPSNLYIDSLVYTKEEFNKLRENGNPFILTAISDGLNLI